MAANTHNRSNKQYSINYIISFFRKRTHPWRRIWAAVLLKTGLHRLVNIRMDGYRIHLSDAQLAISSFINQSGRKKDEQFLAAVLQRGDVYVDVGANIGTLVLKAASHMENCGTCIAIEAHPQTFGQLEKNVALNPFTNIQLICSAVGNASGTISFSNSKYDDVNKVMNGADNGIEVPVQKLDTLLNHYPNIALLKIDVEGYEKMVLEGASKALEKIAVVYFESWESHFTQFGYHTGDVIALLEQQGFQCFKTADNKWQRVMPTYTSTRNENLVALKDPQAFISSTGFALQGADQIEETHSAGFKMALEL